MARQHPVTKNVFTAGTQRAQRIAEVFISASLHRYRLKSCSFGKIGPLKSTCHPTVIFVLWAALLLALSPSETLAAPKGKDLLQGNALHGRELFVSKGCIECHSVRGVGGTVGPDLGLKVFNKSVYEIAGILWNHSPFMSQKMAQMGFRRPQFNPPEMLDLISFLYFLNYFDPPGDVRVGRQLWVEKRCADCHSSEGRTEKVGPPLERMQSPPTSVFLAQSMWNHGAGMLEMFKRLHIEPPTFQGAEMVDLAAHIRQANRNPRRQLFNLGDARRGDELFHSKGCASCHSSSGTGKGAAPDLSGPEFQASVSQITGQMWNHLPRMYERMLRQGLRFPTFSGEEMNHLISYIYSLAYEGRPGDAQKGVAVFREKRCVFCHGEPGKNQQRLGPDLATIHSDSPLGVLPTMWNHALEMEGRMRENQIAWPRFEGGEMADLQAYLKSTRQKAPRP
ncbi:MAG TPA: c-type cytochrome [Acidobacteriota bacterium]